MSPFSTSRRCSDRAPLWRRVLALLLVTAQVAGGALTLGLPGAAEGAVRNNPAWWNGSNGTVGTAAQSAWHYRVPITLPNGTPANATIRLNVDFSALLASLGVTGTFDVESPRVVDASGVLVPTQEYTESVYNGATDATAGRGEVRFILPSTSTTYWLYFDTTANGAKPALADSYLIGGNFENSSTGTLQPPGWTVTRSNTTFDAQVRPSESPSIATNGTTSGNGASPRTVNGTPLTGQFSYLLGARTSNEPANSGQDIVVMSRTFTVPASSAGNLVLRYRVQGWDSNDDGNTTQYDYMSAELRTGGVGGTVVRNLVGPDMTPNLVPYTTLPYSPNKGTNTATNSRSGYGQYNGFDTDTNGTHRAAMSVARGSEPWWTVTQDLSAWAGQTITLRIATSYTNQYKSWWHLDDVEWSVVNGSVGTAQAFGAVLQLPAGAATTTYYPDAVAANRRLVVRAQLDAVGASGAVLADLYGPAGTLVAGSIPLYNDGTHGDATAGDAIWTNDGSATPSTYTFPAAPTAAQYGTWTVVLRARDAAGTEIRIQGQPATPVNGTNFYNVDTQTLSLQPYNTLTGRAYVDVNRNGIYNSGDTNWAAPPNLYVKLVQNGAVVSVATPNASTGIYTFGSLRAGRYTVVPSANNSTGDPNPSLPAGYTQSQPNEASFTIDLADGQTVNNDIGLHTSDLFVNGRVLVDNGAGGATALDGTQGGSEQTHSAIVVQAATAGGTVLAQTSTAGDGTFSLALPSGSAGAPVVLSIRTPSTHHLGRVFAGTTAGTLNPAAGTVTFTPAANTSYGNVVFSTIPVSVLTAGQMKTAPAGTAVFYAHRLSVGASGTLTLGVSSSASVGAPPGWTGVLYQDASCTGALNGSESPLAAPISVTAGSQVCLVLRDSIPAAAQLNQDATHTITATLTVGSISYTAPAVSNVDVTTVGSPQNSGLTLVKAVRNLTTSGAFGTSGQALPGQSLQYQLTFRNDTATPVSNVQINDAVPAYGVFDSAACGTMPAGVGCAVVVQPASGAGAGALQWNLTGPVPAGASGTVTFNWTLSN